MMKLVINKTIVRKSPKEQYFKRLPFYNAKTQKGLFTNKENAHVIGDHKR